MRLLQIVGGLVAAYALLVSLAWLFQRRLIYLPMDSHVPPVAQVLPGAEDVELTTADGLQLGAWFLEGQGPDPAATVIFCNGNAGNRSYRAAFARALAGYGVSVLLFDYRGYGGNPGSPTEQGLIEDLRAAIRFVVHAKGVPRDRLVLAGESLGAAVALAVATEPEPPAGLILRSPFLSMTAVAKLHYPFLPVTHLLKDRYPNDERIGRLECPLLVLAGADDEIVPAEQSRALFAAATNEDKDFILFRGANHNSEAFLDGPAMIRQVVGFVGRVIRSGAPSRR